MEGFKKKKKERKSAGDGSILATRSVIELCEVPGAREGEVKVVAGRQEDKSRGKGGEREGAIRRWKKEDGEREREREREG